MTLTYVISAAETLKDLNVMTIKKCKGVYLLYKKKTYFVYNRETKEERDRLKTEGLKADRLRIGELKIFQSIVVFYLPE